MINNGCESKGKGSSKKNKRLQNKNCNNYKEFKKVIGGYYVQNFIF